MPRPILLLLPLAMPIAPLLAQADPAPLAGTRLEIGATGEVQRTPDLATIGAGVVTQASAAGAAMARNAQAMAATIAALKRAGIADRDIQTAALNLAPQYRYADNQPPALTGYQASNRVTVRLRDLAKAGGVIDALVAAGANQIDGPSLSIDQPEAALDEARAAALAMARRRAELYARAAGLHVKRIVSISETGQGLPQPIVPMMRMMARAPAPTPIAAGESTLSVSLQVTFELD